MLIDIYEAAQDLIDARKRLGYAAIDRNDLWLCLEECVKDKPPQTPLDAGIGSDGVGEREAIQAVTAEMRRIMPHACGDWADRIDLILRTSAQQ